MQPYDATAQPRRREGHHQRHHADQELETIDFQSVYHQVLHNAGTFPKPEQQQQQLKQQQQQQLKTVSNGISSSSNTAIIITEYTVMDILSGRGGLANKHAGNRVYRRLIDMNKPLYRKLSTKMRKAQLVESILRAIHNQGGRFLKQSSDKKNCKTWFEIDYKEAFNKTSQALREPNRPKKHHHSAAAARNKKTGSSISEASTSDIDDDDVDEDDQAGNNNDEEDHDNHDDVNNNISHSHNHPDDDKNEDDDDADLSDEDIDMLTMYRATTLDLFPETANMLDDPSIFAPAAVAATENNLTNNQHHRHTWTGVPTLAATTAVAAAEPSHDNHHHAPLGQPILGNLLDESEDTTGQGPVAAIACQPGMATTTTTTHDNNLKNGTTIPSRVTRQTSQSAPVSPVSLTSIKTINTNKAAFSFSSAPSSPGPAASLWHWTTTNVPTADNHSNIISNINNNHRSLFSQLPPPPEAPLLRMNTSRAMDHLANANDHMPMALDPLSQMRSSGLFPAALDSILLRQDSLDFSSSMGYLNPEQPSQQQHPHHHRQQYY